MQTSLYVDESGAVVSATWEEAEEKCKALDGGHLVTVHNAADNDAMTKQLKNKNVDQAWIGYYDKLWTEGDKNKTMWLWVQFNPITDSADYTNWAPGEPNNNHEKCGELKKDGKWNDRMCDDKLPFFCAALKAEFVSRAGVSSSFIYLHSLYPAAHQCAPPS